jgi:hypothetical protein
MRTTITIDEDVLDQLKARAAKEATTITRLIEDSVRLAAQPHSETAVGQPFELVTFGKGGRFTSLDVDRISTLIEQDDEEQNPNLSWTPEPT